MLPGAFKNNGLCRVWGPNRVYYGEFGNRECKFVSLTLRKDSANFSFKDFFERVCLSQIIILLTLSPLRDSPLTSKIIWHYTE